jgi:chromosome partitioning protein
MDLKDRIAGKLRDLVAEPIAPGQYKAQVIAIASSKGGVGKTTTAVNLSIAFARQGFKVLTIDLDPQAHVAASLQTPPPHSLQPISDVLLGRLREVIEVTYPYPRSSTLHLAGSDKGLAETEMILSAKIGKELIVHNALTITRTHYDLIIIDCPPNLGTLTLNALCASDHLLIPTDMSILALEGVGDILEILNTLKYRLDRPIRALGILATRFDRRATRTNAKLLDSFNSLHANLLFDTKIPQASAINKAHMVGKSVFEFDSRSPGAIAYASLAEEVASKIGIEHHHDIISPAHIQVHRAS